MAQTPPPPPAPPSGGQDVSIRIGGGGISLTGPAANAEVAKLQAQVQVLRQRAQTKKDELGDVATEFIKYPSDGIPAVLTQRHDAVQRQLAGIEKDLAAAEAKLTDLGVAPSAEGSSGEATTVQVSAPDLAKDLPDNVAGVVVAVTFIVFIGFPLALAFVRRLWKRGTPERPGAAAREDAERLRRIETAVEAMAIELERISEGQRFVTKVMSETSGGAPALPAGGGPAEPVPVPGRADAAPAVRPGAAPG